MPEAKTPPVLTKEAILVKLPEASNLWVPAVWRIWGLKVPPDKVPVMVEEAALGFTSKGPEI